VFVVIATFQQNWNTASHFIETAEFHENLSRGYTVFIVVQTGGKIEEVQKYTQCLVTFHSQQKPLLGVCIIRPLEKGKAVPLQAWSGPEGSRKLKFPDFMTAAQDGGKVVSLTHRPPLPPGNTPGTHFC
jgi:hypothetical protein